VSNGLLTAERRGRIDGAAALRFGRMLLALPIAVDPVPRGGAFAETRLLARTHRLTSYDGAYLEAALRLDVPLATLDQALRSAARAEGVRLHLGG